MATLARIGVRIKLARPAAPLLSPLIAPTVLQLRGLCAATRKPDEGGAENAAAEASAKQSAADGALEVNRESLSGGGSALMEHEGENLPPLEFEPGVAGVAQKGVSAVVIAIGALAFGAIAWGTSQALFPGASSTNTIFSEAFEKVQQDAKLSAALGTPLRAHGSDHGGNRGRRNTMERWEVVENGEEMSVVRFHVSGPNGQGDVVVQTPKSRSRGQFRYIIFETPHPRGRAIYHVYDSRAEDSEAKVPAPPVPIAPAAAAAETNIPPPPAPIAPATAGS